MRHPHFVHRVLIASILAAVSGCALFTRAEPDSTSESGRELVGYPPDRVTRDTIQLEILMIDRSGSDPLMGRILWDDVDEIGAVELDVREKLNTNGLRVGVAGSTLPQALQTLLESSRSGLTFLPDEQGRLSSATPITLLAGTDTVAHTAGPKTRVFEHVSDRGIESTEYENAVCVLRIRANRLQDGWAKLEFIPEIHHGENRVRHHANDVGWEMRASQDVEVLHDQRFEIMLNVGETAIISSGAPEPNSVGDHFFTQGRGDQRLMILRLADLGHVEGLSRRLTGVE